MRKHKFILGFSLAAVLFVPMVFAQSKTQDESLDYIWRQNLDELRLYVNDLLRENQDLRAQKAALQKEITDMGSVKAAFVETKVPPSVKEPKTSALKKEIESLKKESESLKKARQSLETELRELKKQNVGWEKQHFAHREKTIEQTQQLEKMLKDSQIKTGDAERGRDEARKQAARQEREIAGLKKQIASCEEPEQNLRKESEFLRDDLERVKDDLLAKDKAIDELMAEITGLKAQNADLIRRQEIAESLLQVNSSRAVPQGTAVQTAGQIDYELSAYNLAKGGNYAEAIAGYKKALATKPRSKNIYFNLGSLYAKLKLYSDAADNFQKALEIDPADKDSLLNLSKIYDKLADPSKARYYYNQYLQVGSKSSEVK